MKSPAEMDRLYMELRAIDDALSTMSYLGYTPKNDSWKDYCESFNWKLMDALKAGEFWLKNPDYKLG